MASSNAPRRRGVHAGTVGKKRKKRTSPLPLRMVFLHQTTNFVPREKLTQEKHTRGRSQLGGVLVRHMIFSSAGRRRLSSSIAHTPPKARTVMRDGSHLRTGPSNEERQREPQGRVMTNTLPATPITADIAPDWSISREKSPLSSKWSIVEPRRDGTDEMETEHHSSGGFCGAPTFDE